MLPPVVVILPLVDAESKIPSKRLLEPRIKTDPAPELIVKLPVVAIPALPTPLAYPSGISSPDTPPLAPASAPPASTTRPPLV